MHPMCLQFSFLFLLSYRKKKIARRESHLNRSISFARKQAAAKPGYARPQCNNGHRKCVAFQTKTPPQKYKAKQNTKPPALLSSLGGRKRNSRPPCTRYESRFGSQLKQKIITPGILKPRFNSGKTNQCRGLHFLKFV